MKRNALRIVCNPGAKQISYYFRNEMAEWLILSGSSPLSRQFYTKTTIEDRSEEIIKKADQIYNRKNKGLDIYYEGSSMGYKYLQETIKKFFGDRDIVCKQRITRIAVIGKKKVGKTYLIDGIGELQKQKLKKAQRNGYIEYLDEKNNVSWCELEGVDLGMDNVEQALNTVRELMKDELSTVIYCVSGITGRIEDVEKDFILRIKSGFFGLSVLTVVTMCYKDNTKEICDEIEKLTGHTEVFPVLAKEYTASSRGRIKGQAFIVEAYGLDVLCTYVFEGKKVPRKYGSDSVIEKSELDNSKQTSGQIKKNTDKHVEINKSYKQSVAVQNEENKEADSKDDYENTIKKVKKEDDIDATVSKENIFEDYDTKKIAIIGKKKVGKTALIEGMEIRRKSRFERTVVPRKYCIYEDKEEKTKWYEVEGIDLGKDKVENAYEIVKQLITEGIVSIAYCISAESGRIEDIEKKLIEKLSKEFPKIRITIILTMCFKENVQELIEDLKLIPGNLEIIQTLAKEYKTGIKDPKIGKPFVIQPFGLDKVSTFGRMIG